jgi:hypothetical protein
MKQEYDFSDGVRGKYLKRYRSGSNVVVLDPEIASIFTSSEAVNEALRTVMRVAAHNKRQLRSRKTRRKA